MSAEELRYCVRRALLRMGGAKIMVKKIKGKNIVVFSDGTGQDGGKGNNTNVYKLFNMVLDRSPEQIAFYDPGIGTGWRKLTGNAAGVGFSKNIKQCYRFIFDNFQAGDRIYLFGFSRGAATVRSLSAFIHLFGILPKSRPELIDRAYKIYRIGDRKKRIDEAEAFVKQHHNMWTKIRFLGVWDTVAALGVPLQTLDAVIDMVPWTKHRFHDFKLSESVENAFHALAVDDERKTFHPVLWDAAIDPEYQTMEQVWFCGMHTDVGGGYEKQELADITLEWMVEKAENCGLKLYSGHEIKMNGNPDGFMHDSRGGMFSRFYRHKVRSWPKDRPDLPCVHVSVMKRKLGPTNKATPPYKPWIRQQKHVVWPPQPGAGEPQSEPPESPDEQPVAKTA